MQMMFQLGMGQNNLDFLLEQAAESEKLIPDTVNFARNLFYLLGFGNKTPAGCDRHPLY